MKRKVVFHIISHLDLGGAERVAVNISKSPNSNFEYHIVEVVKAASEFSNSLKRNWNFAMFNIIVLHFVKINLQYACSGVGFCLFI